MLRQANPRCSLLSDSQSAEVTIMHLFVTTLHYQARRTARSASARSRGMTSQDAPQRVRHSAAKYGS